MQDFCSGFLCNTCLVSDLPAWYIVFMNFIDIDANNFINIYKDLCKQFPPEELKSYERFIELINSGADRVKIVTENSTNVGYVIFAEISDSLWLDYIAIFKEYHSKGYGSRILTSLSDEFKKGIYLEVEKPDEDEPNTLRRIKFYTNLGAKKLDYDYFYPAKNKPFPMDLYYLPYNGKLPVNVEKDVKKLYSLLHSDIEYLNNYIK